MAAKKKRKTAKKKPAASKVKRKTKGRSRK